MPTLRACPFCGNREIEIDHLGNEDRSFFVANCRTCQADGPISRTEDDAIDLWNTRRRPSKGDGQH